MPDSFTVIVTYNAMPWIEKSLSGLAGNRVIVVDNGSGDGTQKFIRANFPSVRLIQNASNQGFGMANNQGIRLALEEGAKEIILLNQDAWFMNGLPDLNAPDPSVGIVSPVHLNGEGSLDFGFEEYMPDAFLKDYQEGNLQRYYQAGFVNAAAWVIPARIFTELGGFHPAFFHYGEDKEFINRLQRHGYTVMVDTSMTIIHDRPQHREDNTWFNDRERLRRRYLVEMYNTDDPVRRFRKLRTALVKSSLHYLIRGKFSRAREYAACISYLREKVRTYPESFYPLQNTTEHA